jgi:multicomponent Na+:H+ antiporter subunit C
MFNNFVYITAILIFCLGLYIILSYRCYFRKLIGLTIFQNSILIFYISFGKIRAGIVPISLDDNVIYSSPLPHVLMLTAIVVGFATMSVGIAIIYKIKEEFGSLDEDILKKPTE